MSWDACLVCDCCGHEIIDQNYTHNCNGMANAVLLDEGDNSGESWWKQLDGMSGPTSAMFLNSIIKGLKADPVRFRQMNPKNKWGDYDSFVEVLRKMRDSIPETSSTWQTSG